MFTTKQKTLIEVSSKSKTLVGSVSNFSKTGTLINENPFVQFGMRSDAQTTSGNGAVKFSTTNNVFVDQFANLATYKSPRSYDSIAADMEKLWKVDSEMTVKFTLYIRMITRQVSFLNGTKTNEVQRGGGLKNEGIVRMIWLALNAPDTFINNVSLFVSAGSWNDIIKMLSYDLQYNGWEGRKLNWDFIGKLILTGIENPNTTNLVKKYLPQIKSNSSCHTLESQADNVIAKWICSLLFGKKANENGSTYRAYRKLKSQGTAHEWQQLISKGEHNLVNFDTVAGRALSLMISSKYLKNHNLEDKYEEWIMSKPVAKFTGFPHELAKKIQKCSKKYQFDTINAQFNNLIEVAKKGLSNSSIRPISVIDVSGSMNANIYSGEGAVKNLSSIDLAASSAIFFNEMMDKDNMFYNKYLFFHDITKMGSFIGNNFTEKFSNFKTSVAGNTNVQSVFNFFAEFKQLNPDVDENKIPNFIVCFSDGEFDSSSSSLKTNVEIGRELLAKYYSAEFASNFGVCIVDTPSTFYCCKVREPKFETFGNAKNTFYFSGFDLSPLGFLFGVNGKVNKETGETITPKTAEELFLAAMDQELLNLVTIY